MTLLINQIWSTAKECVGANLSVIPIEANQTKRPARGLLPQTGKWPDGSARHGWGPFQRRLPSEEELNSMFNSWCSSVGIAVVCGRVSGGLEAIDIDSSEYAEPWLDELRRRSPDLLEKLVLVRTPRPGLHAYYRCSEISGNEKLAQKILIDQVTTNSEVKTIIETRGEGGYALIPPTPGHCHPTGRTYEYLTSRTLVDVQEISVQERALLFEVSRSFHETSRRQPTLVRPVTVLRVPDLRNPVDDFNANADWNELLVRHGWLLSHRDPDGKEHWTRPGKTEGTSATLNYGGNGLFHVFSSNAEPLESERSYTKFHFVVVMEYQGNFKLAKLALRRLGFGQSSFWQASSSRPNLPRGARRTRGGRGRRC